MTGYTSRATIARCEASRVSRPEPRIVANCACGCGDIGPHEAVVVVYRGPFGQRDVIRQDITCLIAYLKTLDGVRSVDTGDAETVLGR